MKNELDAEEKRELVENFHRFKKLRSYEVIKQKFNTILQRP